jgi:hypothetical protein
MECSQEDCEREATFELHVPWTENREMCAAHARVESRKDGVVADALETADDDLPEGAANRGCSSD